MGHYDDARDAHEEHERRKLGKRMRAWIESLTDEQLGSLRDDLDELTRMRSSFIGNYDQTSQFRLLTDRVRGVLGI